MIINIIVVVGLLLDLILTYNYLKIYKTKFPDKDYTIIEANPLVRFCIRTKGLREGIFLSAFILVPLLITLIYLLPEKAIWFLAGCYYMMITFHLTNLLAIKRLKGVKK